MQLPRRRTSALGLALLLPVLFPLLLHVVRANGEPPTPDDVARNPAPGRQAEAPPALRWVTPPPEQPAQAPADVELADLRAQPDRWLERPVHFVLQYAGPVAEWQPYLTHFGPADYVSFQAWSDQAAVWEQAVYDHPASYLFARRGSEAAAVLALAKKHSRYEVEGVVRDVFRGEPWIEVASMRRLDELVPEGTLLHVQKARAFQNLQQWDLALDQLDRAEAAPLPAHAREALQRIADEIERDRQETERTRDRVH